MKINKRVFVFFILVFITLNANAINIEYGYLVKPQCSMKGTEYIYVGNILTSKKNFNEAFEKIRTEVEKKPVYDGHIKVSANTAGLVTTPDPIVGVTPIHIQTQLALDLYIDIAQKMRLRYPNVDPC